VFLFGHKAFSAKKDIKTAHILNSIENSDAQQSSTFNFLI
jgi:hypothetical protein